MMKKITILIAGLALTVFSGVVRGRLDQRWGSSPEMLAAAQRVEAIPAVLGSWQALKSSKLTQDAADMLRCDGNIVGDFVHQDTGRQASMVFITGPAGPLAQHVPEACYASNNFSVHESTSQRTIVDAEGAEHRFSVVTFRENNVGDRLLRVYFAWNRDGEWVAPASPRTSFAGVRHLYKIQVATNDIPLGGESIDAGEQFLKDNLPLLKNVYK